MSKRGVFVAKGSGGWGVGLYIEPNGKKNKVVSITGGGIHPVAQRIAELTGAEAVDGFKASYPEEEMMCVVIDCGGTARIGVYPMKRIPYCRCSSIITIRSAFQIYYRRYFCFGCYPKRYCFSRGAHAGRRCARGGRGSA